MAVMQSAQVVDISTSITTLPLYCFSLMVLPSVMEMGTSGTGRGVLTANAKLAASIRTAVFLGILKNYYIRRTHSRTDDRLSSSGVRSAADRRQKTIVCPTPV